MNSYIVALAVVSSLAACSRGTAPRVCDETPTPAECETPSNPSNGPSDPGPTTPVIIEPIEFERPEVQASSEPVEGFTRGVNLGNRLDAPTEGAWGSVLSELDFDAVKQGGFDHVRLPVRFSARALAEPPYTLDEAFLLDRVDWAIEHALDRDLGLILDLHHYDELFQNVDDHAERFLSIWSQLSERYRDLPNRVVFELLNEPNTALDPGRWNQLAADAIAVVREQNPERVLLVGSAEWNAVNALEQLELPDDPNVVAVFHFYEPSLFTFQGKSWMPPEWGTSGIVFPGPPDEPLVPVEAAQAAPWSEAWFRDYNTLPLEENPSGPTTIFRQFELVEQYLERTGRRAFNTEFTAQNGGDLASRVHWLRLVRQECERRGIGWSVWEDGDGGNLFNHTTGEWNATLLDALIE